jgi:hypothetical protein
MVFWILRVGERGTVNLELAQQMLSQEENRVMSNE